MRYLKHSILAAGATLALALIPVAPASAHGGPGFLHPWGLGRGLVGAVAAVVTLPLALASAALEIGPQYGYEAPPSGYYPPPNYYGRAPAYYGPPSYYPAPRHYYAPAPYYGRPTSGYYAPRGYPAGQYGYHSSYGGNQPYRSGGPGYRR